MTFRVHTIESAPEESKPILSRLKSEVGFIPNLAATMAESPALIDAFTALRAINSRSSSLSAAERELASIAVAREYECSYCVAAHSTFAVGAGAPESVVEKVRQGESPTDTRTAALTRFASRVVRAGSRLTADDARDFLNAGFNQRQVLDVFSAAAQVALASQTFLLARTPLDGPFQPREWSAGERAGRK